MVSCIREALGHILFGTQVFLERQHAAGFLAFFAVLALALVGPAGAAGSSGEFTRAEANADWSLGSIAGSITWTGCGDGLDGGLVVEPGSCQWLAYATIGPGSDPLECASSERRWPELGEGISVVWPSGHPSFGVLSLESSGVPLVGGADQLACLSVIESYDARPSCWDESVICPQFVENVSTLNPLASAELGAPIEPPNEPEPEEPKPEPEEQEPEGPEVVVEESTADLPAPEAPSAGSDSGAWSSEAASLSPGTTEPPSAQVTARGRCHRTQQGRPSGRPKRCQDVHRRRRHRPSKEN